MSHSDRVQFLKSLADLFQNNDDLFFWEIARVNFVKQSSSAKFEQNHTDIAIFRIFFY